jgi:hypothetical protein
MKAASKAERSRHAEATDLADGADAPEPVMIREEKYEVRPSELEAQEKIIELSSPAPEVAELDSGERCVERSMRGP